jgi:mercuric ion transport protein
VGNLAALDPLRLFFIGATVLFVALAFRRLHLVPQVCKARFPSTPRK